MKTLSRLLSRASRTAALLLAALSLIPTARAQVNIDGTNYGSTHTLDGTFQSSSSFTSVGNSSSAATLNVQNGGFFSANHDVTIGNTGLGVMRVITAASSIVGGHLVLGSEAGSNGSLLVSDPGSYLDVLGGFTAVGFRGVGSMSVQNHAAFQQSSGVLKVASETGSTGLLNVTGGTASLYDFISGGQGNGTTTVQSGGTINVSNWLGVGTDSPSHGNLTISDGGSTVHANTVALGDFGQGTVSVTNGGAFVANDALAIGSQSSGHGLLTVDGAGSTVNVGSFVGVGQVGTGELTVRNGGLFHSAGYMGVGQDAGSLGSVMVQDGGTLVADQDLHLGEGHLGSSTGSLIVSGPGSGVTVGQNLLVGQWGTGALAVQNGGLVTTAGNFEIGTQTGSSGNASVDGAGSTVSAAHAYLGAAGAGNLTLSNGGSFQATGWSALGVDAAGTLNINTGGSATFGNDLIVGVHTGGNGLLSLDGAGSAVTVNGGFEVGQQGSGSVSLSHGAALNTNGWGSIVGHESGSTGAVTVDGAGSAWANSGDLLLGWGGTGSLAVSNGGTFSTNVLTVGGDFSTGIGHGTLAISSGGTVNSLDGLLGNSPGSSGTATVDGAGSAWHISSDLEVGLSGTGATGALAITNGGAVTAGWFMGVGDNGNAGTVLVDGAGSSLSVQGALVLAGSGPGTGALTVAHGGSVSTLGELVVGATGTGSLALTNGGAVAAAALTVAANAGSSGTVTVDGGNLNTAAITIGTGGTLNYNSSSPTAGAINSSTITNAGQFSINTRDPIAGTADVRTLGAAVTNLAAGRVDVNLANGASVTFTGPVTNDGLFKVTQLAGTSGGVTSFTGTFTNTGTFISDPTTTHFEELFNLGQFTAGPGDTIITDHGFVNHGTVDIFGGAEFYGDYSGPGSLLFHISSATDRLFFNSGFSGSLELVFDPGYLLSGTENFLSFGQGAYLSSLLIGGIDFGSMDFTGPGYLTGDGRYVAGSVPDSAGTLGLFGLALSLLFPLRRRLAPA